MDEQEFISNCMSELKDEHPDQKQRLAICYSKFRKKEAAESVDKIINELSMYVGKAERDSLIKAYDYELEEVLPFIQKSNLSESQVNVLKYVFSKCMNDGHNIAKSYEIAKSLTMKVWNQDRMIILKTIENILKDITLLRKGKDIEINGTDKESIFEEDKEWSDGSVTTPKITEEAK